MYAVQNLIYRIVEKFGGKDFAMKLLCHDDSQVKHQALLALQKIFVQNW